MMMMNHRYGDGTATHSKALLKWTHWILLLKKANPPRAPCGANNEAEWDKMWIRLTAISKRKSAFFFGSQQGIHTVAIKSAIF